MDDKSDKLKARFDSIYQAEEKKRLDKLVGTVVLDCLSSAKRKLALKKLN